MKYATCTCQEEYGHWYLAFMQHVLVGFRENIQANSANWGQLSIIITLDSVRLLLWSASLITEIPNSLVLNGVISHVK